MAGKTQQKVTKWKIGKLKDHPKQAALFGDLPDAEFAALVANIAAKGLDDPVEILPDGTIVAGHQRVRAARKLGWTTINVIVRNDLAKAGPMATEAYLVSSNLTRRQLSPLGQARCVQRLMEIEQKVRPGGLMWEKKDALKEEIGRRLGMCGRNVGRYLLVLKTPLAVQQAFDKGEIGLTEAGRVAMLESDDQEAMVRRIQAGEKAAAVADEFIEAKFKKRRGVDQPFLRLVGALNRELPLIKDRAGEIDQDKLGANLPALLDASAALAALIEQAREGAE